MPEDGQIEALITLLDDPDQEVWRTAFDALSETDISKAGVLLNHLYSETDSDQLKERLERCIEEINYKHCGRLLKHWKDQGGENLLEAIHLICALRYPELSLDSMKEQLEALRLDAWLEFHYDLTSFEKVKILNYILFQLHGFRGDEENFMHPENSFINKVLENRKGNPVSLSIIYILVAQRLNVPVYGINLPKHFIMAYVEDEEIATLDKFNEKQIIGPVAKGEIQFYINAYNGGGVFNKQHLQGIMKEMGLDEKPEFMTPCTNPDIVLRVLMNLYNSYSMQEKYEAELIDKMIHIFQSGS